MEENKLKITGINSNGFGIIAKLVMQDRNFSLGAKGVYAYFCSYAGAGNICFPSRKKMCYDLGISQDTLGKYLKELIKSSYVSCEQIKENGKFSHNVYTINTQIPLPKLPLPKISVSENFGTENLDTNNNNYKNNNYYNNNNITHRNENEKINVESFKKNQGVGFLGVDNLGLENQNKEAEKLPLYNQSQEDSVKDKIKSLDESEKIKKLIWQVVITNRHYMHRPITNEVLRILLDNLQKYSNGNEQLKIEILETATSAGYTTIYPLKNNLTSRNTADKTLDITASYDINSYESEISDNYENYLNSFMNKM